MTRTLGTNLTAGVALDATAPIYLIQLDFDSSTLRYTTGPDATILSQSWVHADIRVEGLEWENSAAQKCRLRWVTNDLVALGLLGTDAIAGTPVSIYITERLASYGSDDALLVFSGVMDTTKVRAGLMTIDCTNTGKQVLSPREYIGPELGFNHNSSPGVFYVGSTKVELRSRS